MSVLRGLLLDNLGIKLVALLLALVVYLHVYTERPATMIVSFPVQFADLADTLSLSGPVPSVVMAELSGTGKQLIRIRLTEPRIRVSLAGVGPGHFERAISTDDLPLISSDRVQVERMVGPRMLDLQVERKITRRVPAAARVDARLPAGVTWSGRFTIDPAIFHVRGPERALIKLDSVPLATVRIDGRRDTVRQQVGPVALPPGCEADPAQVTVIVPVSRGRP